MDDKTRALEILRVLKRTFPQAPPTYLNFRSPFELLIATILSAHTTDKSVNSITPILFERFPDAYALAQAPLEEIKEIIRPCGTYNKKAVYIQETAKEIVERFNGNVPASLEELTTLPGVSRKTANVVLSVAFQKYEGIVVDTHVNRVTNRLGLSAKKAPKKIERELMELIPKEMWGEYSRLLSALGREVCNAKAPRCSECPVHDLCASAGKFN